MNELSTLGVPLSGLLGSLVAGLGTGLGALPVFLRERWSASEQVAMLAFAAGVMLAATVFSLILPALETARAGGDLQAGLLVAAAIVLGALGVWAVHGLVPHEHFVKGAEGSPRFSLGRHWLFILAITLHNFPEGMSVGVSYGGGTAAGLVVTLGIGLQNLPEGLAVAAALIGEGFTRLRAVGVALMTGLVEPVGGLVGAAAVSVSDAVLPWGLGIAAGAMLYVISGEIIPEVHRDGNETLATFGVIGGFVGMMVLGVWLG